MGGKVFKMLVKHLVTGVLSRHVGLTLTFQPDVEP